MNVRTAVIMVAGYGTRMLPVTAGVQKEMLPILDRPVIDYTVADCVAAGITRIIFVIRPGTHALQDYYLGQPELERHLERFGKTEALAKLRGIHQQATFDFIEQPAEAGYGTGVPVKLARQHLAADEPILVCNSDDFLYRTDGQNDTAGLIGALQPGMAGVVSALEKPESELQRYGILAIRRQAGSELLTNLVEKPVPGTAPSNLANLGKYVLAPVLLEYVDKLERNPASGEYFIIDAIAACAKDHPVGIYRAGGRHLDAGSLAGWLEANMVVAKSRPELAKTIQATISSKS
jgi:UTP--glucose-1-phosphate uridylyltransferase